MVSLLLLSDTNCNCNHIFCDGVEQVDPCLKVSLLGNTNLRNFSWTILLSR